MHRIVALLIFFSVQLDCQIPSQAFKGLYNNMPENTRYLSPLNGFSLLKTNQIYNWYHFNKKIAPSKEKSPLFELVGLLFHAPLRLIKISENVKEKLTEEIIAAILMRLPTQRTLHDLDETVNAEISNELNKTKKRLTLHFQNYTLSDVPNNSAAFGKAQLELNRVVKDDIRKRILEILHTGRISSELKNVVDLLVNLAFECAKGSYYPYCAHDLLLAFLCMKIEQKTDFKKYFLALNSECNLLMKTGSKNLPATCEILQTPDFLLAMDSVLNEQYSDTQLDMIQKKLEEKAQEGAEALNDFIIANYEKVTILFGFIKESFTPLLPGVVILEFGNATTKRGFTDCGEASTRNILNIALFNPATREFDITLLKRILTQVKYKNNPDGADADPLVKFYKKYNTIAKTYIPESRKEWAQIVSGIPNVDYQIPDMPELAQSTTKKVACEIKGRLGIINLIRVLEYILFDTQYENDSQNARLERIFDSFKSPIKKISFEFESANNKWGDLIISVNGHPSYALSIEEKHFELQMLPQNHTESWWEPLLESLISHLDDNNLQTLHLLAWLPYEKTKFKTLMHTVYRAIQESNLPNQESKDTFFNQYLFTLALANSFIQETILELNATLKQPLAFYLNFLNPSDQFIESLIQQSKLNTVKIILQADANNTQLITHAVSYIVTQLSNKNESTYMRMNWPGDWGSGWQPIIKNLSIEDLEQLQGKMATLITSLEEMAKKSAQKNVQTMVDNAHNLKASLDTILQEKKELKSAEGITSLFED